MLTVLMATRNGAATLPAVLEAYCKLSAPVGGWRLLVIDNGSDDGTRPLLARYVGRLPLRVWYEPARGKNLALNSGLAHLLGEDRGDGAGDLLVFSDDDATPEPDWLLQLSGAAAAQPGYAIFGGSILPDWAESPPAWVARLVPLGLTYGLTAADQPEGPVFPGLVWGANMALRKAVFLAGHRFDTGLGPNGGAYAMGGETEFARRLDALGYRSWFCPAARVRHHIRATQLTAEFILQRAWRFGRGAFRQAPPRALPELLRVPRWMLRRYLVELVAGAAAWLRRDTDALFLHRWERAYLRGYAYEAWLGGRCSGKHIFITSYSGELGGMELRMAQEARFLRAAGYHCGLGTRRFPGYETWSRALADEQIAVEVFNPPLFFEQWRWRRLNKWRADWWWARRLRSRRCDLVHVALCWTNYGASALWLAQRCNLPAVLSVHNAFPPTTVSAWHHPLLLQAFRAVRGVYAVSPSALAHFLAIFQPYIAPSTRLAVIPNCVDTARFLPSSECRRQTRQKLGLPQDGLVLGAVARLSDQKRPSALVALFARLRTQFPQLYLVLAGQGPLEHALRAQVNQAGLAAYVIFTGFVPAVERLLPAFDLHVLMSRNEGFGIATIEAMACGVPAVATAVPGSIDILRDSGGGMLIPPDDLAGAAALIAALLEAPDKRAEMASQARREVEEHYSCAVVGALVRDFYDGLV